MPGTRRDKFFRAGIIFRCLHRQNLFPIRPVAILDPQGNRSADGFSVAHAGKNLRLVFLDFLSPPAAVAEPPAVQNFSIGADTLTYSCFGSTKTNSLSASALCVQQADFRCLSSIILSPL